METSSVIIITILGTILFIVGLWLLIKRLRKSRELRELTSRMKQIESKYKRGWTKEDQEEWNHLAEEQSKLQAEHEEVEYPNDL